MHDLTDRDQATAALVDPTVSPADLAAIAQHHPSLRARVAAHPLAYPALLDWLRDTGDPDVVAAVNARQAPSPARQAVPPPPTSMGAAPTDFGRTDVPLALPVDQYRPTAVDQGSRLLQGPVPAGIALACGAISFVLFIVGVTIASTIQCYTFGGSMQCGSAPPSMVATTWLGLLAGLAALAIGIFVLAKARKSGGTKAAAIIAIVLAGLGMLGAFIVFIIVLGLG